MKVLKTDNKVKVYLRRCLVKERNTNFSWKAWEIISEQLKGDGLFGQETLRGVISTELCGHKNISFLGLVPFLLIYFFFPIFQKAENCEVLQSLESLGKEKSVGPQDVSESSSFKSPDTLSRSEDDKVEPCLLVDNQNETSSTNAG